MDKDIALVTATVPDYHDGLREKKTEKSANGTGPSGYVNTRGFQVSSQCSLC
jgi:hypothetical protein